MVLKMLREAHSLKACTCLKKLVNIMIDGRYIILDCCIPEDDSRGGTMMGWRRGTRFRLD